MFFTALSSDEKTGLIIGLITFVPLIIFLFTFVPISVYRGKREKWILVHSSAINKLEEINKKYTQFRLPAIGLIHNYDNEKFYNEIKPKDYLVYQLKYNIQDILTKVSEIRLKLEDYQEYISEINVCCKMNRFSEVPPYKSVEKIRELEKELFKKRIKRQNPGYFIKVTLNLIKSDGKITKTKCSTYSPTQISRYRERINDRNDDYYIHKDIWDSLTKVERGIVTNKLRFEIYKRDEYKCCRCGAKDNLEIDHIVPISKGGKSTINNLQTLCHNCNIKKGVKAIRYVKKNNNG